MATPPTPIAGALTINATTGVILSPVTAALFKLANGIGSGSGDVTASGTLTATRLILGGGTTVVSASDLSYSPPTLTVPASFGITGAGSLAFMAGGTNQNITLTPSGSGVLTSGSITQLTNATAATTLTSGALQVTGGISTQNEVYASTLNATSASSASFVRVTSANGFDARMQFSQSGQRTWYWYIPASSTDFRLRDASGSADVATFSSADGALALGVANRTRTAWGTTGPILRTSASTYTDSTSSGTVATAVANSFAAPTFAASSATTFTNAANLYIAGDVASGTNVTLTNSYGLWNAGKTRLDGAVVLPSTNISGLQLYNTADQTTNYERLSLSYITNAAWILSTAGGTGTGRTLNIAAQASSGFTSSFSVNSNSTSAGTKFTAGQSGGSHTQASGQVNYVGIVPTYNQIGGSTASNTDLLINRTQTAVGSGAQLLIDAQVGGTSKFKVSNTGTTTLAGPLVQSVSSLIYASPTSVDVTLANVYTVTTVNATGSVTFNATAGGTAGQEITFIITNDATSAKTITFGTNFTANGTLTASGVSKKTTIQFISDGTAFVEVSRTVLP